MVSIISPALRGGEMPPPPTPITKRPTLAVKRNSSYLDTDDETTLSASTKKLKVAFSPNVDVRTIVDDWDEKSFDLVKEEVRVGIERHLAPAESRDDTQYLNLLQLLDQDARSEDAASSKLLKKYLAALDAKVSSLADCGKLVMATLDLSWLGRDDVFVSWYIKFLCSLATTHTKFTSRLMDKLVAYFGRLPASLGRLPGEAPVSRALMFSRVHLAIKTVLRQVPSSASALIRSLKFEFPNDMATTRSYIQYQKQLLQLAPTVPALTSEILALITQRLVNIDVQIQQDLEDLEDEVEDSILQGRREDEYDSDDSDIDSMSESEETTTEEERRIRDIRAKVTKMDGTLDLLFEYYTPLIEENLRPEVNTGYQQLMTHFQTFVMPSRTRHAQFLLFHFSQTTTSHVAFFAQQCLQTAMAPVPVSQRLTACAYMSSFVARGAHIPQSSVREVFNILCGFLESMRSRYETDCRGPDKRNYAVYYAAAQAILYIFCFRWRDLVLGAAFPEAGDDEDLSPDDLLADARELAWLPGIKETLQKNIYSKLNPLKVCSPAIVGEFAKIANHVRFLYVFPKLELNKRLRLGNVAAYFSSSGLPEIGRRETAFDRKTGEAHLQLEAYFPFDPYHLPNSKRWVQGDYNEWKLPSGMHDEDDDEDDDEEEADEDSDDDSLPEDFTGDMPIHDNLSISS